MWPSTRFQWLPPCNVRRGRSVGFKGFRIVVCRSVGLQGSRRPCVRECQSAGWIWRRRTRWTTAGTKSWLTGCRSSTVPNSPWSQREMQPCTQQGVSKSPSTLSPPPSLPHPSGPGPFGPPPPFGPHYSRTRAPHQTWRPVFAKR